MSRTRELLVTTALPYANGPLHLGHLLESIQADIWVRSLRLAGHRVSFVCADDAHGTPIMLKAEAEGVRPETLIEGMRAEHERDLGRFAISFDHYHSTHSPENQELVLAFYHHLAEGGHLRIRTIRQMYDPKARLFLPDRYIRGTCPRCGTPDQYGDSCENCGASYDPTDLISPRSSLTGLAPEARETEHVFVRLENFKELLETFVHQGSLDRGVQRKLDEWLASGLRDWDITRDAPYFGFPIPNRPDQYFYVWLDAPIGYLASFKSLALQHADLDFHHYLRPGSPTELYHFIGKDIIYFHGLFWPALLASSNLRLPTSLWVHGFLTVNGQKMSKSRGTFLTAQEFADGFPPEALRYYFALKLGSGIEDIDLNLDDLIQRFNGDLVGKLVNLAARSAPFLRRGTAGYLSATLPEPELYDSFRRQRDMIVAAYEAREYSGALRLILDLADRANHYFAHAAPWKVAPADPEQARAIATQTLNLFRLLAGYLKPVLPDLTGRIESWLEAPVTCWSGLDAPLLGRPVAPYAPLLTRLAARTVPHIQPLPTVEDTAVTESKETIDLDLFNRLDLRIARILSAERVEGSSKLIRLRVSLGAEERTVFAGIQAHYAPEDLVDRLTVVIANLAPRKMRFGISEAMVLAANDGTTGPFLLAPDAGAEAGMIVR
ncbi:methionyl-tRNA synthetase [mine drainage metagenome]|uniref:Methionine--tRNA ligase n=1 Tax=mine drainage metagenome TaxID=410659 RepID=T1BM39_9ZZZZ